VLSNHQAIDAGRQLLPADRRGTASAAESISPSTERNQSAMAFTGAPSRRLRRYDSLPGDVTAAYDIVGRPGHVVLSSTRLMDRLTATLNALSVDCRQSAGARYRANSVAVTSGRHGNSAATRDRTPAANKNGANWELTRVAVEDCPTATEDVKVAGHAEHGERLSADIETETPLESPAPLSDPSVDESVIDTRQTQQAFTEDGRCEDEVVRVTAMDVTLDKGPLGLGFCIDGGLDAPGGPSPITVKRLFKGRPERSAVHGCSGAGTFNAVERRSGKYFGAGTALRQILLATGGTLTLKCSGKSRRTR